MLTDDERKTINHAADVLGPSLRDLATRLRAIAAPRVATVGELLATAPVGAIVEFWHGATANQITTRVGGIDRVWLWRYATRTASGRRGTTSRRRLTTWRKSARSCLSTRPPAARSGRGEPWRARCRPRLAPTSANCARSAPPARTPPAGRTLPSVRPTRGTPRTRRACR